jgi:hypothetical protein
MNEENDRYNQVKPSSELEEILANKLKGYESLKKDAELAAEILREDGIPKRLKEVISVESTEDKVSEVIRDLTSLVRYIKSVALGLQGQLPGADFRQLNAISLRLILHQLYPHGPISIAEFYFNLKWAIEGIQQSTSKGGNMYLPIVFLESVLELGTKTHETTELLQELLPRDPVRDSLRREAEQVRTDIIERAGVYDLKALQRGELKDYEPSLDPEARQEWINETPLPTPQKSLENDSGPNLLKDYEPQLEQEGKLSILREFGQWPPTKSYQSPEGPKIWYSDTPVDLGKRRAQVVYLLDEESQTLKTRCVYASTTHIALKVMPRAIARGESIVHYDKGLAEEAVTLHTDYQRALLKQLYTSEQVPHIPQERHHEVLSALVNTVESNLRFKTEHLQDTYYEGHQENSIYGRLSEEIEPEDFYHPEKTHLKDADLSKNYKKDPEGYLPLRFLESIEIDALKYGRTKIFFFESTDSEKPQRYMVPFVRLPEHLAKGKSTGALFVAAVESAEEGKKGASNYLVPKLFSIPEKVTIPLFEKPQNLQNMPKFVNEAGGRFSFDYHYQLPSVESGDVCTWNYLKKIPLIRVLWHHIVKNS